MKKEIKKYSALLLSLFLVACTTQTVAPTNPEVVENKEVATEKAEIENGLPEFTKLPEVVEVDAGDSEKDVLSQIEAKSFDGSKPEVRIEGEVNFEKAGEYKVKVIAEDSAGVTEKDLTIKVNAKTADKTDGGDKKVNGVANLTNTTPTKPTQGTNITNLTQQGVSQGTTQNVVSQNPGTQNNTPSNTVTDDKKEEPSNPSTPSKPSTPTGGDEKKEDDQKPSESPKPSETPKPTEKPVVEEPKDTTAPVITAEDITIDYAHKANFASITANDETDGLLLVTIAGDYNNRKAGVYPMSAIATDGAGNTSKVEFKVIVNAHPRQGELEEAEGVVDETGKLLSAANEALTAAQAKLDELNKLIDEKMVERVYSIEELSQKRDVINGYYRERKEAETALEDAKKAYEDALAFASTSPEFLAAKENLDAKTAELEVALADEAKAKEELEAKQSAHEIAVLTKDIATKNVESKQAAKEETEKAVAAAEKALQDAQADAESAVNDKALALQTLQDAREAYDSAVAQREQATKDLEDAKKVEANAQQRLADVEAQVATAAAKIQEAQDVINQGSYGFFVYHGSEGAVKVIDLILEYQDAEDTTMTEGMRTNLGAEDDATGLNNVEKALEIIRQGNEYRATDNNFVGEKHQAPLLVTDTMMAIAEVRANASSDFGTHWSYLGSQGYHVGENLTWGYTNPQQGWYTDEKAVWDWMLENGYDPNSYESFTQEIREQCAKELGLPSYAFVQVGHYENLMDDYYKYTGAAYDGDWPTASQEFAGELKQKGLTDKTYTVDEYLADFLEYKNKVEGDLEKAKKAHEEVVSLYNELNENNGLTVSEKEAIDKATTALETATIAENAANQKVTEAQEAFNTKSEIVEEKQAVVTEKETELSNAQDADNSAYSALETAVSEELDATQEVKKQEEAVANAEVTLEMAQETVEVAKENLAEAEEVINTMNDAVAEAHEAVVQAQGNVETVDENIAVASEEVQQAEQAVQQAEAAVAETQEAIVQQEVVVENTQQEVTVAEENYNQAVEVRDEIQADIDNTPEVDDSLPQVEETPIENNTECEQNVEGNE